MAHQDTLETRSVLWTEIVVKGEHALPNRKVDLNSEEFKELLASVKAQGVIQNPVCWAKPIEGQNQPLMVLLAGRRRYAAMEAIRKEQAKAYKEKNGGKIKPEDQRFFEIDVALFEGNEDDARAMTLIENFARQDLTDSQFARSIGDIHELFKSSAKSKGKKWSQRDTGRKTGVSQARINECMHIVHSVAKYMLDAWDSGKVTKDFLLKLSKEPYVTVQDGQRKVNRPKQKAAYDSYVKSKGKGKKTRAMVKRLMKDGDVVFVLQKIKEYRERAMREEAEGLPESERLVVDFEWLDACKHFMLFARLGLVENVDEDVDIVEANTQALLLKSLSLDEVTASSDALLIDAEKRAAKRKAKAKGKQRGGDKAEAVSAPVTNGAPPKPKPKRRARGKKGTTTTAA